MGYMSTGPIPWAAIDYYCRANEIYGEQRDHLFYHVERLDKAYLDWVHRKNKQSAQAGSAAPKRSGKR